MKQEATEALRSEFGHVLQLVQAVSGQADGRAGGVSAADVHRQWASSASAAKGAAGLLDGGHAGGAGPSGAATVAWTPGGDVLGGTAWGQQRQQEAGRDRDRSRALEARRQRRQNGGGATTFL